MKYLENKIDLMLTQSCFTTFYNNKNDIINNICDKSVNNNNFSNNILFFDCGMVFF